MSSQRVSEPAPPTHINGVTVPGTVASAPVVADLLGISVRKLHEIGAPRLSRGRYHVASVLAWEIERQKRLMERPQGRPARR